MMNKLKLLCFICFLSSASFAQQSDSLSTQNNQKAKTEVASSTKTENKYLAKQASVSKKETTTWTKIKDLFM